MSTVIPIDEEFRTFEPVPEREAGMAKVIHDALLAAGWTVYACRSRFGYAPGEAPLRVWYLQPGHDAATGMGYALMKAAEIQTRADG